MTHGKPNEREEIPEIESIFSDCVINNDVILQQRYLQYINSLRQMLKRRISYVSFVDVSEELSCLDKVIEKEPRYAIHKIIKQDIKAFLNKILKKIWRFYRINLIN